MVEVKDKVHGHDPIADEPILHNLVVVAVEARVQAYPPGLASFCTLPNLHSLNKVHEVIALAEESNTGTSEAKAQLAKHDIHGNAP